MGNSFAADLRALNAPPAVRDALAVLPSPFAEAFAAEAVRLVEAEAVPGQPPHGAPLPVPFSPLALAHLTAENREVLTMGGTPGRRNWKLESLPVARWRVIDALVRFRADRLHGYCRGFLIVRSAWEEANRRELVPGGADWPPLVAVPFAEEAAP